MLIGPSAVAGAVVLYAAAWLLIGSATWAVAEAIDDSVTWNGMVAAAIISWVAGFLAVPVPGGIGVREATFVLAVPGLASGDALAVATVARVLFVLIDALGALVAARMIARSNRRSTLDLE